MADQGDDARTGLAGITADDTMDEAGIDPDMEEILAFEEARMRGWKRRCAALLAALRRHHPERDPARHEKHGSAEPGVGAQDSGDPPCGRTSLRPIRNAAMVSAHVMADGLSRGPRRIEASETYRPDIGIADIRQAVCQHYRIAPNELVSDRRQFRITRARHVAMYVAKILTARSFPDIGRQFGDRDHTTVLHAVRKIERDLEAFRDEIDAICDALR